jgi:hypothetical protein
MSSSYRIRTELGVNKTIQVKLEQNYDTLELLSLTISPNNLYTRACADYGVVCGRVFCNNGFGLPNDGCLPKCLACNLSLYVISVPFGTTHSSSNIEKIPIGYLIIYTLYFE